MFTKITDNWRIIAIATAVILIAVGVLYFVLANKEVKEIEAK
jgi:hypothetical protein